jgi:hypothetical protein
MAGAVAAVAAAVSALAGLALYLLRRSDSPEKKAQEQARAFQEDVKDFDEAICNHDGETLSRLFIGLDGMHASDRLRQDGSDTGGQGDKAAS